MLRVTPVRMFSYAGQSSGYSTNPPKTSNLSFRGAPWKLDYSSAGVYSYGSINSYDAIKLYDKLACGNYLDIGDDKTNFYNCNKIRENNLAFLDRVTETHEQRKFIDYYRKLTGFPDLTVVSNKIKNEFTNAISKASDDLYYTKYQILQAGYDGVCSVGRKKALPGSDIDKAYIIIRGTGNSADDVECVNQFKGRIWNNTDQRILSFNHDEAAFPQVYTIGQFEKLAEAAEKRAQSLYGSREYDGIGCPMHHWDFENAKSYNLSLFNEALDKYNTDYVEANRFYINVCSEFPKYSYDRITKENIKNIGFVLEAMREGETFDRFGKIYNNSLTDSLVYKLVNLSQLKALKNRVDSKPKRLARESLKYDFNNWSIEKQFRFVKTLIKYSCANNRAFTTEFSQYFSKPGQDLFEPLIKALMR